MVDFYSAGDRLIGTRVDLGNGRSAYIAGMTVVGANGAPATGANAPQSQPVDSTGAPQFGPSGKAAVTGTFTAAGLTAANNAGTPYRSSAFSASVGRAIWATLRYVATKTGTVTVLRSADGVNYYPLTVGGGSYAAFTASCQEPVSSEDDAGVSYLLECTATNDTITYRLGHS